jgi:hypothetical protein
LLLLDLERHRHHQFQLRVAAVIEFEADALPHVHDLFRAAGRVAQDQGKASDAGQGGYSPQKFGIKAALCTRI